MKKLLLLLFVCAVINLSAQTETHNLNWFSGIGSNVDLTIESGDTVIWTWTSPNHTVENDPAGTSVETFDSGFLAANGSTFSYTFTTLGTNDYYCGIHGAGSMSGTITVVADGSLSVPAFKDSMEAINIYPNPASSNLNIDVPSQLKTGLTIEVYDVLGKKLLQKSISKLTTNISISQWNTGVYLMKISSADKGISITKKVVKI